MSGYLPQLDQYCLKSASFSPWRGRSFHVVRAFSAGPCVLAVGITVTSSGRPKRQRGARRIIETVYLDSTFCKCAKFRVSMEYKLHMRNRDNKAN
jgi:hypothetical protein